ncbi:uncharacterized protein [Triticum aestivum]|uniref:uncharacterized protein n=1 Tax=Triticum aestivum TaxID=4565 RepID=UPI001D027378|nr:uncharacterized protein LOC123154274 [Triticum aestivum]
MAATLISNAARRLAGCALQPAVRRARMVRIRQLTADETKDAASLVEKIKTRKEELYDLIAHCERNYVVGGSTGLENGQLLEYLSHQVKPRPNDPHWRSCHRATTFSNYVSTAGRWCLGYMIMGTFFSKRRQKICLID